MDYQEHTFEIRDYSRTLSISALEAFINEESKGLEEGWYIGEELRIDRFENSVQGEFFVVKVTAGTEGGLKSLALEAKTLLENDCGDFSRVKYE